MSYLHQNKQDIFCDSQPYGQMYIHGYCNSPPYGQMYIHGYCNSQPHGYCKWLVIWYGQKKKHVHLWNPKIIVSPFLLSFTRLKPDSCTILNFIWCICTIGPTSLWFTQFANVELILKHWWLASKQFRDKVKVLICIINSFLIAVPYQLFAASSRVGFICYNKNSEFLGIKCLLEVIYLNRTLETNILCLIF